MSILGKLLSSLNDKDKYDLKSYGERRDGDEIDRSILYGGQRKDGGHDHRTNRGDDRTPAQRDADKRRRK